jgi:hypothetical protein
MLHLDPRDPAGRLVDRRSADLLSEARSRAIRTTAHQAGWHRSPNPARNLARGGVLALKRLEPRPWIKPLTWALVGGAGDGNRTRMAAWKAASDARSGASACGWPRHGAALLTIVDRA